MAVLKHGGNLVKGGTFFNLRSWEFVTVPRPQGYLAGTAEQLFIRVPVVLVLLLGPVLGLFFVILLPLVGVLAIPIALGRGLYLLARRLGRAKMPGMAVAQRRKGD